MTCNDKCIHFPVCEEKKYDFANIDECQHYEEKRPHGEWNVRHDTMYHFECPFCKYLHQYKDNFCPLCGADMRVKNELNSEIEKSKSEIVPDYRDGWRLRGEEE